MSASIIKKYFPNLSVQQYEQYEQLSPIYQEWNQKINVISRKDMDFFMERHVLHSLSISSQVKFKKNWYVVDLGTGGGFPGIPLAIMYPEVQFVLIDSIRKKINVVEAVKHELALKNVRAIWGRVEDSNVKANLVVTRAVTNLPQLVEWSKKVLKPQSKGLIALKGGNLEEEIHGLKKRTNITPISDIFEEPFFETKYIVHYKP